MYLDSSVLVKLYVTEPDSGFFVELVEGQIVATSYLAYTELWSALIGKERNGSLSTRQRQLAWSEFHANIDEEVIALIPMSAAIFKRANRILEEVHPQVPLRSLDALHLASCDQSQSWPLCTNDKRMRLAAERLKYPLTEVVR
jgi:predicted nucleic acid-binding protein